MQDKKYYIVRTKEELELLYNHINDSEVVAVDTETSGLNPRKDKVVGWSVSGAEGIGFYLPTLVWNFEKNLLELQEIGGQDTEALSRKLLGMLKGKKLVFHNASFDVQFIKNFYGVDLGPDIWVDTGLLVHTVYEEGAFGYGNPFALKSIAIMNQEELGLDAEKAANEEQVELKQSILDNGGKTTKAEFEIYKADLNILGKYAAADTDLTLRICNLYLKKLKEEGLEKFFFEEEVMPVYREVTLPMEQFGVEVDMDLILQTDRDITAEMKKQWDVAYTELMKRDSAQNWVVRTAREKFAPSNKGSYGQRVVQRFSLPLPKSPKTGKYTIQKAKVEELEDSKAKQFMLGHPAAETIGQTEADRISLAMWKESNEGMYINMQSSEQMAKVIFEYEGLARPVDEYEAQDFKERRIRFDAKKWYYAGPSGIASDTLKEIPRTKKGFQFDKDMIKLLAPDFPWMENLRIYNALLKIKSTYVDRFKDRSENGRYFFYFKQNGTVSGRYGSDAQQLPKPKEEGEEHPIIVKYTNVVRAFLVAGKGRKVIDADYESLEPHCFASVTGDTGLQEIFNKNWDFYSTIAIKTEKLDDPEAEVDTMRDGKKVRGKVKDFYPNGVSSDKKADNFLKKLDPFKRNTAKGYALGIAYGMEAFALSMGLGISQGEAQKLVDGYLNGFPQLKEWRERSREEAKAYGRKANYVGRIRHLPKVKRIYEKFGDRILDWRFRKELEKQYSKEDVLKVYRDYRNGLNNVLNFQLQSLAAAVVNRAAVQINLAAKEMNIDAIVQAQVHDQLIINIAEEQADKFAPVVQRIMESTTQLPGVQLKAPPEIADNWKEGH